MQCFISLLNYCIKEDMWTLYFSKSIPFDKLAVVSKLSLFYFSYIRYSHASCKHHLYLVMKNVLLLFRLMLIQSALKRMSTECLLANSKYLSYNCQVSLHYSCKHKAFTEIYLYCHPFPYLLFFFLKKKKIDYLGPAQSLV